MAKGNCNGVLQGGRLGPAGGCAGGGRPGPAGGCAERGKPHQNPCLRAGAFIVALLLLSGLAHPDFANDFRDYFGNIFKTKFASWHWYAALAISICFLFNLAIYMASKVLQSEELKRYALSEFMQVTASALMIAFAAELLFELSSGSGFDLMGDVLGVQSVVACGAAPGGTFQLWDKDPDFGIGPLGAFRCKLQEKITALESAYNQVYEDNKATEQWSSTCIILFGFPVYCGDWDISVHKRMEEAHLIETKIVGLLVPLHSLYALATYVENNMLSVFLPAGLVLRIFPLSRGVGGLFIAIAFALFFIWPIFYVLTDPTFVRVDEAQDPNSGRVEGACFTGFKGTAVLVQNLLTRSVSAGAGDALENSKGLVFQLTISIMFYPFIALVIALIFIRALTPLLGGDMGEFMKMVGRLG